MDQIMNLLSNLKKLINDADKDRDNINLLCLCFLCSLPMLWTPLMPAGVNIFLWAIDIVLFSLLCGSLSYSGKTLNNLVCMFVVLPCCIPFLSTGGPLHGPIPQIVALSIMALCLILYAAAMTFGVAENVVGAPQNGASAVNGDDSSRDANPRNRQAPNLNPQLEQDIAGANPNAGDDQNSQPTIAEQKQVQAETTSRSNEQIIANSSSGNLSESERKDASPFKASYCALKNPGTDQGEKDSSNEEKKNPFADYTQYRSFGF